MTADPLDGIIVERHGTRESTSQKQAAMTPEITVVIPTIPPRHVMLRQAVASVAAQTLPAHAVQITVDDQREGATTTRNRGLNAVTTEWVAFLDDDDLLDPDHLASLAACAAENRADLVYPWFRIAGPNGEDWTDKDPLGRFWKPFDPHYLRTVNNYIPVTVLAKTEVIRAAGGFKALSDDPVTSPCEDWGCWLAMLDIGARFVHLPRRTWTWRWWGGNTSGRGERW